MANELGAGRLTDVEPTATRFWIIAGDALLKVGINGGDDLIRYGILHLITSSTHCRTKGHYQVALTGAALLEEGHCFAQDSARHTTPAGMASRRMAGA
jgi:hypothetical protein